MNNLQETVKMFVCNRLEENYKSLLKDKQYSNKKKACNTYIDELNKNFTTGTFEEYRQTENLLHYKELEEAYKLGFNDSINIFTKNNL